MAPSSDAAPRPQPEDSPVEDVVPLQTEYPFGYWSFVRRALLAVAPEAEVTMLCFPSFAGECGLALVPPLTDESSNSGTAPRSDPWTLHVATARFWLGTEARWNADWEAMDPEAFDIKRASIPIDAATAEEIWAACELVVRRARNPAPRYIEDEDGTRVEWSSSKRDGTLYEFSAGRYLGTAHSPDADPAVGLVGLMNSLSAAGWVKSEARRAPLLQACALKARDLRIETERLRW